MKASPSSHISVYNQQKDLPIKKAWVKVLALELLRFLKLTPDELSIYFITEKKSKELHKTYFEDPTPTDCMSFPLDENYLGDIFICPKVALEYAKKRSLDPYREVSLYLIHGVLHLIGYDDLTKKDRAKMRRKEKDCLKHLDKVQKDYR